MSYDNSIRARTESVGSGSIEALQQDPKPEISQDKSSNKIGSGISRSDSMLGSKQIKISSGESSKKPENIQKSSQERLTSEPSTGSKVGRAILGAFLGLITVPIGAITGAVVGVAGAIRDVAVGAGRAAFGAYEKAGGGVGGVLAGIGAGIAGGIVGALAGSVSLITGPLAGAAFGASIARDFVWPSVEKARTEAESNFKLLGTPMQDGVMSREVSHSGSDKPEPLSGIMKNYLKQIDSNLSPDKMESYINMGERLVDALQKQEDWKPGDPLNVQVGDKTVQIKPNLETAKAISWYLTAKGVVDNSSKERPLALMERGSMVVKDEGGKLFKFLNSAPNTYGRVSSHFNERATDKTPGFKFMATGLLGGLVRNQSAQRGIEDFSNQMPSGKGCLLFDKIESTGGKPDELFLKWEQVGVPSLFGNPFGSKTHSDDEGGWTDKTMNRFMGQFRCFDHALNFVNSHSSTHGPDPSVRREKVESEHVNAFMKVLTENKENLGLSDRDLKGLKESAKSHGLYHMQQQLQEMQGKLDKELVKLRDEDELTYNLYAPGIMEGKEQIAGVLNTLEQFNNTMGEDLGIGRKGSEIHVSLKPLPPK